MADIMDMLRTVYGLVSVVADRVQLLASCCREAGLGTAEEHEGGQQSHGQPRLQCSRSQVAVGGGAAGLMQLNLGRSLFRMRTQVRNWVSFAASIQPHFMCNSMQLTLIGSPCST